MKCGVHTESNMDHAVATDELLQGWNFAPEYGMLANRS